MIIFIYPGTFDPVTKGHGNVIARIFQFMRAEDKLIVALSRSVRKKSLFLSCDKRLETIQSILQDKQNRIYAEKINGNTADFIHEKNGICVRGIRNFDDLKHESYWPVTLSSDHPVEMFLLFPIFDEKNVSISSTAVKKYIQDAIANNDKVAINELYNSDIDSYTKLKDIIFYQSLQRIFEQTSETEHEDFHIKDKIELPKKRKNISLFVADFRIIDNGHINIINHAAMLSEQLIIAIPEKIEDEEIDFETRMEIINNIIDDLKIKNIVVKKCDDNINLVNFCNQNTINTIFFELREDKLRSAEKLKDVFNIIYDLYFQNIESVISIQKKYRDFSQSVLFELCHNYYDEKTKQIFVEKNRKLELGLPRISKSIMEDYLQKFYKNCKQ